ncbi:MAG: adenylate/guanylate cyclase domain-containing protein, partial [Paracoccaceae bacterium]
MGSGGDDGRRSATVLIADVAGYSRLIEADEARTLARVRALFDEAAEPALAAAGGRLVKRLGDGFLAEAPDAAAAVEAALALQAAAEAREGAEPAERRLRLRIGVATGEITAERDDVFGQPVVLAARLEGMCEPGGVLVSEAVADALPPARRAAFRDNGPRKFRNLSAPVAVWSWPEPLRTGEGKPRVHLAPFEGRRPEEAEAAADLTDELRAQLARLTGLELVEDRARAAYLVEGSVRLGGGGARVAAPLVSAHEALRVWDDRLREATDDPLALAEAAAPRLATALRRRIAAHEARRLADRPLDELSFEALLNRAGAAFFTPTREGWEGGGRVAEQALALRPDDFMALAMAAAGLGLAEPLYGLGATPAAVRETALARIDAALRVNGRSDMAHCARAGLLLEAGRLGDALAAAERSLEVNPDYNMGFWMRGLALLAGGRAAEAWRDADRAAALEPNDPYVHLYLHGAGLSALSEGDAAGAAARLTAAEGRAPGVAPTLAALAVARLRAGDAA